MAGAHILPQITNAPLYDFGQKWRHGSDGFLQLAKPRTSLVRRLAVGVDVDGAQGGENCRGA
jgi:hypothetical protein